MDTSRKSKASKALNRLLNEDVGSAFRGFEGQFRHSSVKNETSLCHPAWGQGMLSCSEGNIRSSAL